MVRQIYSGQRMMGNRAWTTLAVFFVLVLGEPNSGHAVPRPVAATGPGSTPPHGRELVFVDASLEHREILLKDLDRAVTVMPLNPQHIGIQQIATALTSQNPADVVQIVSHGQPGKLRRGSSLLNSTSTENRYASALAAIGHAISENGDILIYGCRLGSTVAGTAAVGELAQVTKANIAASDEPTGSSALCDDGDVEVHSGEVSAGVAVGVKDRATSYGILHGICDRTPQVRDALLKDTKVSACARVTAAHLATLKHLHPLSSDITTLQAHDFSGLSSLESLSLNSNDLSALPRGVFQGLHSLKRLSLDYNSLSTLPEGVFSELRSLQSLGLRGNSLRALPTGIFGGLSSLLYLNLDQNSLAALPGGVFSRLNSLRWLKLHNNSLKTLPQGIFSGLISLTELSLADNHLTALPDGVFRDLRPLERLYLGDNSLSELPEDIFGGLRTLKRLSLSGNNLNQLPDQVFHKLSALKSLRLDNNAIRSLPKGGFRGLTFLEELWLENNSLTALPEGIFKGLSTLRDLSLQDNTLSALPDGVFRGLNSLHRLWLDHNSLSTLPAGIFSGLSNLKLLHLNGNNLSELPRGVFDDMLATLGSDIEFGPLYPHSRNFFPQKRIPIPGGLQVDPELKATLAFPSTTQRAAEGATVKVTVTLSRPLPVAVRVPFSVGDRIATRNRTRLSRARTHLSSFLQKLRFKKKKYAELSPIPESGLVFLAGETSKEIIFTLSEDPDNQEETIVLTLAELSEIGLRRSDGRGNDAPYLKTESLLDRPADSAVHTVTVAECDP